MKKFISFFLSALLTFVFTNPVAFAAEEVTVDLQCQYLVGSTLAETTIHGVIAEDGNLYVSPEEAAKVAGFQFYSGENVFISQNSYTGNSIIYQLDVNTGKLSDQESPFYPDRTWEIPLLSSDNGSFSVSLNHLLAAMNAEMKVDPSAEIPLTIYRPFTVFDANTRLRNGSYFFEWTEIDETATQKDADWLYKLSALNSLFLDYNSHFVSDAAFAWWSDDVLNANEQQYLDSMIAVMTCFSHIDPSITDSIDYQTAVLQGEVFGLTNDMLELLGIGDETAKLFGLSSNAIGVETDILEQVSKYKIYRQISESQKDLLRSTFLSSRGDSAFQGEDLKIIKNAAQHLQTLLDNSALGTAAAVSDGVVKVGSGIVQDMTPLALMDVASFIMSILPGTSQAVDINETTMLATHSAMLELFAREEYSRINDEIREKGPSEDLLRENKETLLFALQASYATRNLFIQNQVFSSDVTERLERKNSETLEFILFLQSCSTDITIENEYSWKGYIEESQKNLTPMEAYANAVEKLQGASFHVRKTGTMHTFETDHHYFTEEMEIQNFGTDIMTGIGSSEVTNISDPTLYSDGHEYSRQESFTYDSNGIHVSSPMSSGFTLQRPLLVLDLPPEECLIDSSKSDIEGDGVNYHFVFDGEALTEENCGIMLTAPFYDYQIYWDSDDFRGYKGGIQAASLNVNLDNKGNLKIIEITYELTGAIQDVFPVEGTTTFSFEKVNTVSNQQNESMLPTNYDTAKQIILDYYNQMKEDDGTYVIFDDETVEMEDRYLITVRYQLSEQEATQRLQEGRIVEANTLVGIVTFEKETGQIYNSESGVVIESSEFVEQDREQSEIIELSPVIDGSLYEIAEFIGVEPEWSRIIGCEVIDFNGLNVSTLDSEDTPFLSNNNPHFSIYGVVPEMKLDQAVQTLISAGCRVTEETPYETYFTDGKVQMSLIHDRTGAVIRIVKSNGLV